MSLKILCVDDSRTVRMLIARAFAPFDCQIIEAGNGEEALRIVGETPPDLLVLDVTMPVMDGLTMLRELRGNPQSQSIPVIMLTAESGRESVVEASNLGVSDYLSKPFQAEKLLEKVNRIVSLVPRDGSSQYDQLAARYGLESVPESILRLTRILASRDASLSSIAEAICQDRGLTIRLLSAANPRHIEKPQYSIEEVSAALNRTGLSFGVLVATCDPLVRAVRKTFSSALSIQLEQVDVKNLSPLSGLHVTGYAEFSGRATGRVQLRFSERSARLMATRVMGIDPAEPLEADAIDDAVGEVVTMVVGNFKSNLCNAGLECVLTPPKVERTEKLEIRKIEGGGAERFGFKSPELTLWVDNSVNPWGE
ncbi:MAG: response regulator [Verrucomicrobia bacterium]|nr:response regulator [Verrucomicrobiota bacterium]